MKPIKLTIVAFGPFASQQEIDFTKLGSHPLFLINGPTGAGKSSILDAICFALYNHTTGAERDPQQMRCDHCDPELQTEVSFEFMLGTKRYLISRSPMQELPKKHGEGTTVKAAVAKLLYLDGSKDGVLLVPKSVTDATKQIEALIGLGIEQFRQVMVLPQGKFRELLMADSKKREQIFSQLFETRIYKKIEDRLKEQAFDIRKAVELQDSKVSGILESANVNSHDMLKTEIISLKPQVANAKVNKDEAMGLMQSKERQLNEAKSLHQRFDELTSKQSALAKTLERAPEIDKQKIRLTQATKAQAIHHLYVAHKDSSNALVSARSQHERALTELKSARAEQAQAISTLEQVNKEAAELDNLKLQKEKLTQLSSQLSSLSDANKALASAKKTANSSQQKYQLKKQALSNLSVEKQVIDVKLVEHAKALEQLFVKQQQLTNFQEKQTLRKQLTSIQKDSNKQKSALAKQQVTIDTFTSAYKQATTNATQSELAWHMGQAALLAKELRIDQPCPVCGSKEHPQPAKAQNNTKLVSKEDLEHARAQANDCANTLQSAKSKLATIENKLAILQEQDSQLKQRLGDYAKRSLADLAQQQAQIQTSLDALLELKVEKEKLEARVNEINTILAQSSQTLTALETTATKDNADMISAQAKAQQLSSQIPIEYQDASKLAQDTQALRHQIEKLVAQQSTAQQSLKDKQSLLDSAVATEKALQRQLEEQEKLSKKADTQWKLGLDSSEFTSVDHFRKVQLDKPVQEKIQHEIENYQNELASLQAVIQDLSLHLKDKTKVDLTLLESALEHSTRVYEDKDKIWRELDARLTQIMGVSKKLEEAEQKNAELNYQYSIIGTLDKVANGNTGNKISLQRFVLSVLLDDVLIQASQRLHIMSSGRYQLLRKEERAKGNKASGLELEVHDGDTGKPRSVATLSGGESFMAALALALGLSDVVQSYAGGIRLDTLFIDEGFGSLDTESLDAAIQVLIDLQSSGRMIGIISHVSELKEQMAKRIDVVRGKTGSIIQLINN